MKAKFVLIAPVCTLLAFAAGLCHAQGIIIDHNDCDITAISQEAIQAAKDTLHIGYGHTSHGSQLTTGMTGLVGFANGGGKGLSLPSDFFAWNNGGSGGALDLHDYFKPGDLGNPDRTTWASRTRDYLDDPANNDVNVIIWSWCGQADTTETNINLYLSSMNQLEIDYSDTHFVYMTGHVNGCSTTENLFLRNQQIRDYCTTNNKILYDFADIDSHDPDGNYYGDKLVNDDCSYDSDGNGSRDKNWAIDWQNSHVEDTDWYSCSSAHSQPLNANLKAYAAWALWTELAASTIPGDVTGDGYVGGLDLTTIITNWGMTAATLADGDLSGDGTVSGPDYTEVVTYWGTGNPPPEPPAATPEPATLSLLLLSGLTLCRRKLR